MVKEWWKIPLGIELGLAIAAVMHFVSSPPRGNPILLTPAPSQSLVVQVEGLVADPGIFSLPPGSRVSDAISAAGGLLPEAAALSPNLARPLKDGEKILISLTTPVDSTSTTGDKDLININTATLEQLDTLPGVGKVRAEAIIKYRTDHGYFISVDELRNVPNLGASLFEQIKDLVTVE